MKLYLEDTKSFITIKTCNHESLFITFPSKKIFNKANLPENTNLYFLGVPLNSVSIKIDRPSIVFTTDHMVISGFINIFISDRSSYYQYILKSFAFKQGKS
jgi:hypothetical protein